MRYYKKKDEIARRRSETQTIGDSIKGLLQAYRLQGKLNEVNLVQRWQEIMGKPIAMKTQELYFKDKKLFVRLTSAPLKHELSMSKSKVVDLLNKAMGDEVVKEVIFL